MLMPWHRAVVAALRTDTAKLNSGTVAIDTWLRFQYGSLSMPNTERAASRLRVVETSDAHEILVYSNIFVVFWFGAPRVELARHLYNLAERLTVELGVAKVSVVSIVQAQLRQAPSADARVALSELHRDQKNLLHRVGLVFSNEGFVQAAIRSVLLSIRNKWIGSSKSDVFRNFEEAASWVAEGLVSPERRPVSVSDLNSEFNKFLAQRGDNTLAS